MLQTRALTQVAENFNMLCALIVIESPEGITALVAWCSSMRGFHQLDYLIGEFVI
jgi:hypothetical protein